MSRVQIAASALNFSEELRVKSEELKAELESPKPDISERSVAYSLRLINLYRDLEKDSVGRILGKQLLRAGTSVGANVHEAQGGKNGASRR